MLILDVKFLFFVLFDLFDVSLDHETLTLDLISLAFPGFPSKLLKPLFVLPFDLFGANSELMRILFFGKAPSLAPCKHDSDCFHHSKYRVVTSASKKRDEIYNVH